LSACLSIGPAFARQQVQNHVFSVDPELSNCPLR
jgi:hypothetical protein